MPDLTRDEIEGLAAGLSEAVRKCLLACPTGSMVEFILFGPWVNEVAALRDAGLIGGIGDGTRLTPLGQQVRTLLQEQSNG